MSAIIKTIDVELNLKQVDKIASFWARHGENGRAMIFAQPRWQSLGDGHIRFGVFDSELAEAISKIIEEHKAKRPQLDT